MADTTTTVKTVDIQLLDADRSNATTIKLDNPKNDLTREQVSAAMQPAFTNGWFLCTNGNVAMYLGDVTINQSIKTKLGGEDFYVTPSLLTLTKETNTATGTITVSGATIQGYRFNISNTNTFTVSGKISSNGLSIDITVKDSQLLLSMDFKTYLIIQGQTIEVNCTIP